MDKMIYVGRKTTLIHSQRPHEHLSSFLSPINISLLQLWSYWLFLAGWFEMVL